jgi:hypothetical protein
VFLNNILLCWFGAGVENKQCFLCEFNELVELVGCAEKPLVPPIVTRLQSMYAVLVLATNQNHNITAFVFSNIKFRGTKAIFIGRPRGCARIFEIFRSFTSPVIPDWL